MKSVRMLAAGAVAFLSLSVFTAPVRACDDRFIQRCEAEAEAAFLAETQSPSATTPRRKTMRPRAAAPAPVKPVVSRARAPQVAAPAPAQPSEPFRLASEEASAPAAPESPLLRRFRGFIDPQPISVNSFEALRRPKLDAQHLTPAPAMPPAEEVAVAADDEIVVAELPADAAAAATPAPATPAPAAPVAAPLPAPAEAAPLPANATQAPADDQGGFPMQKLVLTLCAALGVASALRFIVRA